MRARTFWSVLMARSASSVLVSAYVQRKRYTSFFCTRLRVDVACQRATCEERRDKVGWEGKSALPGGTEGVP